MLAVTDPACPRSWAAEPARRSLEVEFAEPVPITYVMAGLARRIERPQELALGWLEAGAASGMPVDARLWLGGAAPRSTHPMCLAVEAAGEQGLEGPYLRRLREALACEGRRLDSAEALVDAARGVPGLDAERFAIDLASNAIVERFGADLELARGKGLACGSFLVRSPQGTERSVDDPAALGAAVAAAGARAATGRPTVEEALRRFGRMAAAEVAAVCDLPGPRAPAELWRLALEWRVRPVPCGAGSPLWELA